MPASAEPLNGADPWDHGGGGRPRRAQNLPLEAVSARGGVVVLGREGVLLGLGIGRDALSYAELRSLARP